MLSLIFAGIAAGTLGLDGQSGMLFYFFSVVFMSALISLKLGLDARPYFHSLSQIWLDGWFTNLMGYMLVWILFHNLVHVL